MRRMFLTVAVTALLLTASSSYAQDASGTLSADDFLTESQGGSTEITAPAEISVKEDVVTAATMQDAVNKATELTVKESGHNLDEPSFKLITSKQGGIGAVAAGRASYATDAANLDAQRLAMRYAYIKAYMEAKKNLAQGFFGLSNEGKTVLVESMRTLVADDETLKNRWSDTEEFTVQQVEGFIRGYEVRRVDNISEDSSICVTISVNGKSLGKFSRPTPAVIDAVDIRTGLTQVFDEIQRGIALPAGGRVIMTESGEACFVGYGSALILDDRDPEMRAAMMNDARRIATVRAVDSLTGLLVGDQVIWETGLAEKHRNELLDFGGVFDDDFGTDQPVFVDAKMAERKKGVLTGTAIDEVTASIRRGVLPPGITQRTFRDNDNVWYYAVAVYNPSATQAAANLADEMRNATLIQSTRSPSRGQTRGTGGSPLDTNVVRPSADVQMIPTGAFGDDDE